MNTKYMAALSLLLTLALTACSGTRSGQSGAQAQSPPQQAAASPATAASVAETAAPANDAVAASATIPVYPGAVKGRTQMKTAMKICGSNMHMTLYDVPGADAGSVERWYGQHMPGAFHMVLSHPDPGEAAASENEVFMSADGSTGITVMQMRFSTPNFQKAAKSIGMDKTSIGVSTYEPPLPRDVMQQIEVAAAGDEAAKKAAGERLKARCGSMFSDG